MCPVTRMFQVSLSGMMGPLKVLVLLALAVASINGQPPPGTVALFRFFFLSFSLFVFLCLFKKTAIIV